MSNNEVQQMKKIGLIVPHDHTLLSIGATFDVIETVNRIFVSTSREKPFSLSIFQSPEQIERDGKLFHGYPVKSIRSNQQVDIVFIPSVATRKMDETLAKNKFYLPWLRRQFEGGAEVASFCTGAFLFGASGLLD